MVVIVFGSLTFENAIASTIGHRPAVTGAGQYFDLLDMHGTPASPVDRSFNIFFDDGAWQGYSLPPVDYARTGFVGPFVHSWQRGKWAGVGFARLSVHHAVDYKPIALRKLSGHAAPGYLVRTFAGTGLRVRETLFFADSWSALVRITLRSQTRQSVLIAVEGTAESGQSPYLRTRGSGVIQLLPGTRSEIVTRLHGSAGAPVTAKLQGNGYQIAFRRPVRLTSGKATVIYLVQTLLYDRYTAKPAPIDWATVWARNRRRWKRYLQVASHAHLAGLRDAAARRVAVKAMETLLGNWRAPRGDLHHAGVIPSYSNPAFNGFWAWDAWKQAAALALFAPKLARSQMRAMFDYQVPDGMIPDCIFLRKSEDNWRNTKPPLATWAALKIYRATHNRAFLSRLYPQLVRYHDWWFEKRDHEHDGLAEYGSTDGTTQAAKWESGMDNAARFDGIRMLRNGPHAWSMNQESVDLNSYLYRDATGLARIAHILGKTRSRSIWRRRAAALGTKIRSRFFDGNLGYFFDVRIPGGRFVTTYGPEGWIPLWAGAASRSQAHAVVRVMRNPQKFATYMPFPSLAADDPRFAPVTGYWRGPVWLDQAYFGIEALRRYHYKPLARRMALRLVLHAKGLTGSSPIYENYDPLTGVGYQSRNFSWSAACYLLLLLHRPQSASQSAHARP